MIQISQSDIQSGLEQTLDVGNQPGIQDGTLKTSSLDMLRALNATQGLNTEQRQMLQLLDQGMRDVSKAMMLTLHSCLGNGDAVTDYESVSFDPDVAAQRLASYNPDTLHRLTDCVCAKRGRDEVNALKTALMTDGSAKDAALQTLAEALLKSARNSTELLGIVSILVLDPQNECLRVIFDKAVDYLEQLRLLATKLVRGSVQESRGYDGESILDAVSSPKRSSSSSANGDSIEFLRPLDEDDEVKKELARAATHAVYESAAYRRAQELRDQLRKLTDDVYRDYAASLSGPPEEQYAKRVQYYQEAAEQNNVQTELREVEGEISVSNSATTLVS